MLASISLRRPTTPAELAVAVVLVLFTAGLVWQAAVIARDLHTAATRHTHSGAEVTFLDRVDRTIPGHATYTMPVYALHDRALYSLYPRRYTFVDFKHGEAAARDHLRRARVRWILLAPVERAPAYLRAAAPTWYRVALKSRLGEVLEVQP